MKKYNELNDQEQLSSSESDIENSDLSDDIAKSGRSSRSHTVAAITKTRNSIINEADEEDYDSEEEKKDTENILKR